MKTQIICFIWLATAMMINGQSWDSLKIARMFGSSNGTMVVYDNSSGKIYKYNSSRSAKRFLPASTFKIPNSLIGLETGVIKDENFIIKWDGVERDNKEWNNDHSLATAIKYSVVPYYQELARRVGRKKYKEIFQKFDYGNKTIGNKVDFFWLDNSLKISAEEQILFLKKFYEYNLPFSKRNIDIVKTILSEEKYGNCILKFKTGTGMKEDKTWIGWLIGYVEQNEKVFFFTFNVDGKTYDEAKSIRDELPRKILKESGLIK